MQNTGSSKTAFKKQAVFLPMRLIRGLHLFYLGVLRPSRSLIARNCTSTVLLACVAGVKRGRGNLGAGERVGHAREKGKEHLQECHCFLHFSRSDSERKNSDWSELIKCQSST